MGEKHVATRDSASHSQELLSGHAENDSARAADLPAPLGRLRFRSHTVHLYAGPCYSLESADGTLIAEYITQDELARLAPTLGPIWELLFADGGTVGQMGSGAVMMMRAESE